MKREEKGREDMMRDERQREELRAKEKGEGGYDE